MAEEIKRKRVPRVPVAMKMRPETIEMLRHGAEYHGLGYHTYAQYLIENGLREEARYYGWAQVKARYTRTRVKRVSDAEAQRKIRQLVRTAEHKRRSLARTLKAPKTEE